MASKGMEDVKDSMWGAYNAKALLLVHIPVSISSAMAVSLVPTLTAAYALGDEQTAKSKVHAILRFISILAFPSAVGLLVLANPIIKRYFLVTQAQQALIFRLSAQPLSHSHFLLSQTRFFRELTE